MPLNNIEILNQRNRDFMEIMKEVINDLGDEMLTIKRIDLYKKVLYHPTPSYYVSERQASRVVSRILRGLPIKHSGTKLAMYNNIAKKVRTKMNNGMDFNNALIQTISNSAPRFYLTLSSAKITYYSLLKEGKG